MYIDTSIYPEFEKKISVKLHNYLAREWYNAHGPSKLLDHRNHNNRHLVSN